MPLVWIKDWTIEFKMTRGKKVQIKSQQAALHSCCPSLHGQKGSLGKTGEVGRGHGGGGLVLQPHGL